jgi:hypothetical protein
MGDYCLIRKDRSSPRLTLATLSYERRLVGLSSAESVVTLAA